MMRRFVTFGGLAVAVLAAAIASAEVRQSGSVVVASTNATQTTGATLNARGILHRVVLVVSGTAKTNTLWLTDTDGTVIYSNSLTSGTTTFTTNMAVADIVVSTASATPTNAAINNTITITVEK
jgi:hypothetical protein